MALPPPAPGPEPWPLRHLVLRTPRLTLRPDDDEGLYELAALAVRGIHPPDEMPFGIAWTDLPGPERNLESFRWWTSAKANFAPDQWTLTLGVRERGVAVGFQDLRGEKFAVYRTVGTGSWLGREFQGRGIGRLMRQAVLALAFDHLGAEVAETEAFTDNPASNKVSLAVGYRPNGVGRLAPRGTARETQRFRMTLEDWRARPRPDVTVENLEPCLPLFGGSMA